MLGDFDCSAGDPVNAVFHDRVAEIATHTLRLAGLGAPFPNLRHAVLTEVELDVALLPRQE